ncbi:MAG: catalase-related domain-containing protein, partial [Pseudomonadota bacterium]
KAFDTQDEDNFSQAGALYRVMSAEQQKILAKNIAGGLVHATASVQERMLQQFKQADADYAEQVKLALETAK